MGGVLASFFSLGPTTSQSSNNGVGGPVNGDGGNIVGKSFPRVNNNILPPATSDVSPSHYEQMRRQPQNATHNLSNIQSSQQQPQKPHHHQQHSSLANFLLFNGFHMYAFNGDIASLHVPSLLLSFLVSPPMHTSAYAPHQKCSSSFL